MELKANAKINWTLDILGQRPDGYHLMDMLMQPITLHDTILLDCSDTLTLSMSGAPRIPVNRHNLALRAAEALQKATGCQLGASIHIRKLIPSGAGLGGGSADAAAVLLGLNKLWQTGLDREALERIGLTIGADVPFCLRGGFARVSGIGEKLETLSAAPVYPLVVIQPCQKGVSTARVFHAYHKLENACHPDTTQAQDALLTGDLPRFAQASGNALEAVSRKFCPQIGNAGNALLDTGAIAASMSGSGSAVFGVFGSAEDAQKAAARLSRRYPSTFPCTSCESSVDEVL